MYVGKHCRSCNYFTDQFVYFSVYICKIFDKTIFISQKKFDGGAQHIDVYKLNIIVMCVEAYTVP